MYFLRLRSVGMNKQFSPVRNRQQTKLEAVTLNSLIRTAKERGKKHGFVVDFNSVGNSIIIISSTRAKADAMSIKMLKPKWKVEIYEAFVNNNAYDYSIISISRLLTLHIRST